MGNVKRGKNWAIRYYDASGRQRWEAIGPNRKETEAVLHQRLYEARTGIYPILRRRSRVTFRDFAAEWESKHGARVVESTKRGYRNLLTHHLLPTFGDHALTGITAAGVQDFVAKAVQHRLASKTINHALGLLKQMLSAAAE